MIEDDDSCCAEFEYVDDDFREYIDRCIIKEIIEFVHHEDFENGRKAMDVQNE